MDSSQSGCWDWVCFALLRQGLAVYPLTSLKLLAILLPQHLECITTLSFQVHRVAAVWVFFPFETGSCVAWAGLELTA